MRHSGSLEMKEQIEGLFNPEPCEGGVVRHAFACPRLERTHKLDLSYLKTADWEGSSGHPHTRLCGAHEDWPISMTESANRPSPKHHSLRALQAWQDVPRCFLAPHVTRAYVGPTFPCAVWKAPHVTRADIGSL